MLLSVNELIDMAIEVSMNGTKKVAVQFAPIAKIVTFYFFEGLEIAKSYAVDVSNPNPEQIDEVFTEITKCIELEVCNG